MIAFAGARRALGCAVAIQRAMAAYDEHAEAPVRLRIGLHTGEATREGYDFFGRSVIVAARIAAAAGGGGVLVSSLVRELTGGAKEFAFGGGGELGLKGVSGLQRASAGEWEEGRDHGRGQGDQGKHGSVHGAVAVRGDRALRAGDRAHRPPTRAGLLRLGFRRPAPAAPARRELQLGAGPETAVRGGGGTLSASIRRR